MTPYQRDELSALLATFVAAGATEEDEEELEECCITLQRWEDDQWIDRDLDGTPHRYDQHRQCRVPIFDAEKDALDRVAALMARYPAISWGASRTADMYTVTFT